MQQPNVRGSDFNSSTLGIPLYKSSDLDLYNHFFRYGYYDINTVQTTREYVFFTKPDLHIYSAQGVLQPELQNNTLFLDTNDRFPNLMEQLQISMSSSPFINILTSTSVNSNLDLPSIDDNDVETSSTVYGDKITYRGPSFESDNGHEFSLEFKDNKDLLVYRLFRIWGEYNRLKLLGLVSPEEKYIQNRILHDQVSAYKIVVAEDGETILYFAKLWGVYPKKVPRDTMSQMPDSGALTYTMSFKAQWVEDLDPMILYDFMDLVSKYKNYNEIPVYNTRYDCLDMTRPISPDIKIENGRSSGGKYKLIWRG